MNFQGTDGFTVFDHRGKLAFRVENYARNRCFAAAGGLLLMDGSGKPLLTVKPKVYTSVHIFIHVHVDLRDRENQN